MKWHIIAGFIGIQICTRWPSKKKKKKSVQGVKNHTIFFWNPNIIPYIKRNNLLKYYFGFDDLGICQRLLLSKTVTSLYLSLSLSCPNCPFSMFQTAQTDRCWNSFPLSQAPPPLPVSMPSFLSLLWRPFFEFWLNFTTGSWLVISVITCIWYLSHCFVSFPLVYVAIFGGVEWFEMRLFEMGFACGFDIWNLFLVLGYDSLII